MGVINPLGFTPFGVGPMPQELVNLLLVHAVNQNTIVKAATRGDWDLAFTALLRDPLCSHLTIPQIEEMGRRLLAGNRRYLPQFFKKGKW